MSDLIKREDVLGACIEEAHKAHRYKLGQTWELNYYEIEKTINSIPTAKPKVGRWIFDEKGYFFCSECKRKPNSQYATTDYCPNCGARMKGE